MMKKGMAASTLGKFILIFLVVFILILAFNKIMKGSTVMLECTANGGQCKVNTCDFGTQVPMLGNKAAGCKNGEICCINVNREMPKPDPLCNGLVFGEKCDEKKNFYCDWALQCVSRCEFCSKNWGTDEVKAKYDKGICDPTVKSYEGFSCKCTKSECDTKLKADKNSCILDSVNMYCPGLKAIDQNYACCK
jgi:hypothetical protein